MFGIALLISAEAAQRLLIDEKLLAEGKINIRPEYPAKAQAQGLTGTGVFILHVRQGDGCVVSVEIQKTTGHKILDEATVSKFSDLRFKPHTVSTVKIPVEFTLPPQNQHRNYAGIADLRSVEPLPRPAGMTGRSFGSR